MRCPIVPRAPHPYWTVPLALALAALSATSALAYQMILRQGQEAPEVPNQNDFLGWSLATGDFNGDGYDDVAMGAPSENEDLPAGREHGAVIVNYGSPRGIAHLGSQFLTVGAIDETLVHYGFAVAAGNFNNDAYDDLAVGLPDFDGNLGAVTSSGAVWIHLGGPTGLSTVASVVLEESWASDALEALDQFGWALTTGYFDDDEYADLAVGAPGEDGGEGAVFVFYGQAAGGGISAAGVVTLRPTNFGVSSLVSGRFGAALDAGDLFGSAQEDLAIGAPGTLVSAMANVGRVYLAPGSATGITTTGAFYQDPVLFGYASPAGGLFGTAIAIGHFWNEVGLPNQMFVGAHGTDVCGGCPSAGMLYLVRDFVAPFAGGAIYRDQSDLGVLNDDEANDRFGFALDAGDWDDDGFDDLAVGIPGENIEIEPISGTTAADAGRVAVWLGGDALFSSGDASVYHAVSLNDTLEAGSSLGFAVAFGNFDDSGRANLAIGAPLKDFRNYRTGEQTPETGAVYILAPWRQPTGRPHRSSAATDCSGAFVFAQRPFQEVPPASVTKAMTVLLAVEAIQAGSLDSNFVYTVPDWVANNVSGSQAGFVTNEQVKVADLLKLAIAISAGDACYAIGDYMTGGNHVWNGLDGTIPGFANLMNIRAMEIGMNETDFNNPSGRPFREHYSTANDWLILARHAMQNELFRYFVGTRNWVDIPNYNPTPTGFIIGMQDSWWAPTDGVKPGSNDLGMQTALWSAEDGAFGRYEASAFGTPSATWGSPATPSHSALGRDLLQLAFGACDPGFQQPPPGPDPPPTPWGTASHIPTGPTSDPEQCFLVPLEGLPGEDAVIEVFPLDVDTGAADFALTARRTSEVILGPGETAVLTVDPIDSHLGFRIFNILATTASLSVTTSDPFATVPVALGGEQEYLVAAADPVASPYSLTIQNTSSSQSARLDVEEKGYEKQASVQSTSFTMQLSRDLHQAEEVLRVCIDPLDPTGGNEVSVAVRAPRVQVIAVEPPPVVAVAPGVRLSAPVPNPFRTGTALTYELDAAGPVTISVHDVSGRRVRALAESAWHEAGSHRSQWDGRDDGGREVPAGIYFQVVRAPGGSAAARVVRLR
jgi:hypothetical protein